MSVLVARKRTTALYAMITIAALLRLLAPVLGPHYSLSLAGVTWCGAFGGFSLFYFKALTRRGLGLKARRRSDFPMVPISCAATLL